MKRRTATLRPILKHGAAKPVAFLLALVPFAWAAMNIVLAYLGRPHDLGANPIEYFIRFNGDWALRLLLITLALSPVAKLARLPDLIRFRRMMGLYAFFYAFAHLMGYIGLDQIFFWALIWEDILKRNFITIGMVTFTLLLPLAITSTNGMMKRLGGKTWRALHRLIYPAAILAVLHYYMMVKADTTEPLIYAGILAVLFALRWAPRPKRRVQTA